MKIYANRRRRQRQIEDFIDKNVWVKCRFKRYSSLFKRYSSDYYYVNFKSISNGDYVIDAYPCDDYDNREFLYAIFFYDGDLEETVAPYNIDLCIPLDIYTNEEFIEKLPDYLEEMQNGI